MPRISELPLATLLDGTEIVPFVQAGVTKEAPLLLIGKWARVLPCLFDYMTPAQVADVQAGTLLLDVTTAVIAAIAANPGRAIIGPAGYYRVSNNLDMTKIGTWIVGEGVSTRFYQYANDKDTFRIRPDTAGVTADFGFLCGVMNLAVYHSQVAAASTTGAAVRITQMDAWRALNIYVADAPEGVTVEGGQAGVLDNIWSFCSVGAYKGADSAMVHFKQAAYGVGQFQHMFTTEVANLSLSAGGLRNYCIRIADCDGLHFEEGYMNNSTAATSLIAVTSDRNSGYVAGLSFDSLYLDGLGTTNVGLVMPNNGFTSPIYHIELGASMLIGNCNFGVASSNPNLNTYRDNANVINCSTAGRSITGGANTVLEIGGSGRTNGVTNGELFLVGAASQSMTLDGFTSTGAGAVVLNIQGTWGRGSITGCTNNSNVADIANAATFTNGLARAGNQSAYVLGVAASSWKGSVPFTKTGDFTVGEWEDYLVCKGTGTITVTLPSAVNYIGRPSIVIKTIAAFTVVSLTGNVVPLTTDVAGTAILPATAGKWVKLVSNGVSWVAMEGN